MGQGLLLECMVPELQEGQLLVVDRFRPCLEVQQQFRLEVQCTGNLWLLGIQVMVGRLSNSLRLVIEWMLSSCAMIILSLF